MVASDVKSLATYLPHADSAWHANQAANLAPPACASGCHQFTFSLQARACKHVYALTNAGDEV